MLAALITREITTMTTVIATKVTPQGLLIPRAALHGWNIDDLEVVRRKQTILVRPRRDAADPRAKVRQALGAAGLLYEPNWEASSDVPAEERARLAEKLATGQPLSEIIIAEREDHA